GLRLAEQNRPDLYVLEVGLIDGSGFDLLKQVRSWTPAAPVVICSADVRETTRQQASAAGVSAFFAKPVNLDALAAEVSRLLSH
ncbi:MAG TPA: response regulator, partial [Trichocoleus sp.]